MSNPLLTCLRCERCLPGTAGVRLCGVDQQPITAHAEAGNCPLGKHARTMEEVRDDLDPKRKNAPRRHMTPAQIRPFIDLPPDHPKIPGWRGWPNVQQAYREAMADYAASIPAYPTDRFFGRGVVIVGGGVYFAGAYIVLSILRLLGCTLPVEVWTLPGESEPWHRAKIESLGGMIREPAPGAMRIEKGWPLKSHAILNSGFREVLYLDADCYPIREPSFLFSTSQYLERGAIYWPDQVSFDLKPATWELLGLPWRDEPDVESGVIVMDKSWFWEPLALTEWMNQHSDFYYDAAPGAGGIHGDKTTFHLAARYLDRDYAMPAERWDFSFPALIQKDFAGSPLFIHRAQAKLALEEDSTGSKVFTTNPQQASTHNYDLPLEDFAWGVLEKLREEAKQYPQPERPKAKVPSNCAAPFPHAALTRKLWDEFHSRPAATDWSDEVQWFQQWTARVPCGDCRRKWVALLAKQPPDFAGWAKSPVGRWLYWIWGWQMHNRVNREVSHPTITLEEAEKIRGFDGVPIGNPAPILKIGIVGDLSMRNPADLARALYAALAECDHVIQLGDMHPAYDVVRERLGSGKLRLIRGNHDEEYASLGVPKNWLLDLPAVRIAGLDNAEDRIEPEGWQLLDTIPNDGKPLLLCLHMPLAPFTLPDGHNTQHGMGEGQINADAERLKTWVMNRPRASTLLIHGHYHDWAVCDAPHGVFLLEGRGGSKRAEHVAEKVGYSVVQIHAGGYTIRKVTL